MKPIITVPQVLFRIKCGSPCKALSMTHNKEKLAMIISKIRKVTSRRDDSESDDSIDRVMQMNKGHGLEETRLGVEEVGGGCCWP